MLELASRFVPVADEVFRLQNGNDAECVLFQKFAEQGHYGGRPGTTRQGTYAATPSGVLLASLNSNDPLRVADMLQRALAKWETLPRAERLLLEDPKNQTATLQRPEQYYPQDGLVLHVNTRDLPRDTATQASDWRGNAWNQDYAWFKKDEARQFVPESPKLGDKMEVPSSLVRRIVRCHLVDNVRGQTWPWDDNHVQAARLQVEVTGVEGSIVSVRLEGEVKTYAEGTWSVRGFRDQRTPTTQKRGFDARLLGKATFDLSKERFTAFELLALGTRFGGTQFNVRGDDLEAAPMGALFTLAGNTHAERVAPAHFGRAYGWAR